MANALGYDDAGRSKLDRVLKGKTIKIDPQMIEDVESYVYEHHSDDSMVLPSPQPIPMSCVEFRVQEHGESYETQREVEGNYMLDPAEVQSDPEEIDRFVVEISGDSMEPEFRSGDRLIVEPTDRDARIKADGVYLFRLEDTIQIKRLQRLPGGRLRVISSNTQYPTYEIDISQRADIEVIGRVWGRFKRY